MSRPQSVGWLTAVTVLAGGLVFVGGLLVVQPRWLLAVAPGLDPALESIDPGVALVALAVLLLLAAPTLGIGARLRAPAPRRLHREGDTETLSGRSPTEARRPPTEARRPPTEARLPPTGARRPPAGFGLEQLIERASDYDGTSPAERDRARAHLVSTLRPIAATAYAHATGCELSAAERAIATGAWTDDRRARALLAAEDGPSTPTVLWLSDLVMGVDPFDRSLVHAIEAIESLQAGRSPGVER